MASKAERALQVIVFSTTAVMGGVALNHLMAQSTAPEAGESTQVDNDRVLALYPELRGLKPSQIGLFETNKGSRIHWLNYTDSKFIDSTLQKTISYFQDNFDAIREEILKQDSYKDVTISQRPSGRDRYLFIVPKDFPLPTGFNGDPTNAATATNRNNEAIMTFIRHSKPEKDPNFPEMDDLEFNLSLATEACQQSILVGSSNGKGNPDDFKQEEICNSLGDIFAVRQTTLSHFTYADVAKKTELSPKYGRVLIFSEAFYKKIPLVGRVLTSN